MSVVWYCDNGAGCDGREISVDRPGCPCPKCRGLAWRSSPTSESNATTVQITPATVRAIADAVADVARRILERRNIRAAGDGPTDLAREIGNNAAQEILALLDGDL